MSDLPVEGLFAALTPQAPDPLLSLIALYREDPRPQKIDLGVGVYRDEDGHTPIMRAMKVANKSWSMSNRPSPISAPRATWASST